MDDWPSPDDFEVDLPGTTPLYSPVTADAIQRAVYQLGFPAEYVSLTTRTLDEFQLALLEAQDGRVITEELPQRAANSRYLHIDRYSGGQEVASTSPDKPFDELLFVSGGLVRSYFEDFLCVAQPARQPFSAESVEAISTEKAASVSAGIIPSPSLRFIPGVESFRMAYDIHEIVCRAFHLYAEYPGFGEIATMFPADVDVMVTRLAAYDDLIMIEPGPVCPSDQSY